MEPSSLASLLTRIERRLLALDTKADPASKAAKAPDAIRNISRAVAGEKPHSPRLKTIWALAAVLETTPQWLLFEIGEESPARVRRPRPPDEQAIRARARQNNPKYNPKTTVEVANMLDRLTPDQLAMITAVIESVDVRNKT